MVSTFYAVMLPYLFQAISSLKQQLSDESLPYAASLTQACLMPADLEPLLWLAQQAVYPKCYWQSRDAQQEVVALGKIADFDNAAEAEAQLTLQQRVWGKQGFTEGHGYFFVPLLELSRTGQRWTLTCNVPQQRQQALRVLNALTESAHSDEPSFPAIVDKQHSSNFDEWSLLIKKALAGIASAKFAKVVLARKTTLRLSSSIDASKLLHRSRQLNQHHFHFLLAKDATQYFIGSTPERLFKLAHNQFVTEALAGTTARGNNPAAQQQQRDFLLTDPKTRHENQLVVEDIVERLSAFSQLTLDAEPSVCTLRHILHLKRQITGKLTSTIDFGGNVAKLLEALQPTAAIAGLPRQAALDFIDQQEPFTRQWYSGSVGFLTKHSAEFCVAIRSALVEGNQLHLYAGAGIVPGSIAKQEWQELNKKLATLLDLLEPANVNQGVRP